MLERNKIIKCDSFSLGELSSLKEKQQKISKEKFKTKFLRSIQGKLGESEKTIVHFYLSRFNVRTGLSEF